MVLQQIEALRGARVDEVILAVNYQAEGMMKFVREMESRVGIKIVCSPQCEPLGTAGPIALARDLLLFPFNQMLKFHSHHGHQAFILVTKASETSQYGVAVVDEVTRLVKEFMEKPRAYVANDINAGIYILSPEVVRTLEVQPILQGFWVDIGKPQDFILGMKYYLEWAKHRVGSLAKGPQVLGNVLIGEGVQIGDGCLIGPDVCIGDRCVVESGARLSRESIVGWHATVGRWAYVEQMAVLGEGVSIADELYCNGGVLLPHSRVATSISEPQIAM
ncbi:hypothetical protein AMTRI_Chr08g166100 [Amborella trichopoda]